VFDITDDYIIFTINRTKEEIEKYHKEQKESLEYSLNKLKKWFNQTPENKKEIEVYLKQKNLEWILKKIK
jgi:hypothetical protein